jgi:hypothetical protein
MSAPDSPDSRAVTAPASQPALLPAEVIEKLVVHGDLSRLTAAERTRYYLQVCESLGLNPATQPFAYMRLQDKLTLYARRECTEQLRKLHRVSVTIVARERAEDLYVVTARATLPDGRQDESIGAVSLAGLKGEALANAIMKAETKAKRRVTLSICGLGMLDEAEVAAIPEVRPAPPTAPGPALPAPAPGAPESAELPRSAAELQGRLLRFEDKLVGRGLCARGDLMDHVSRGLAALRLGPVESLSGEGIAQAVRLAEEFRDRRQQLALAAADEPISPEARRELEVLARRKGRGPAHVMRWLKLPADTPLDRLTMGQWRAAMQALQEEPDAAQE